MENTEIVTCDTNVVIELFKNNEEVKKKIKNFKYIPDIKLV